MIPHFLVVVLASGIFPFILFLLLDHLSHLRHRSVDEVGDCHVKPDHELIEGLYDPTNENLVYGNFRAHQRRRMEKLRQQLVLERNNAQVDMQWGRTEWHDMIGSAAETVYGRDMQSQPWWKEWFAANIDLRLYATVVYVALNMRLASLWLRGLFWRFLPAPRLASMRSTKMVNTVVRAAQFKIWLESLFRPQEWRPLSAFDFKPLLKAQKIDYVLSYTRLKTAVSMAGRSHGDDISEYLVSKM